MKFRFTFFFLLLFLFSLSALTQVNTAVLNGTVTDATGAVVAGAVVTVSNPATGFTRTARTNQSGYYSVPFLTPGMYELRVESPGFATVTQREVRLLVGQQASVNVQMKPGAATEVVEVTAETPLIDSTRSEIGTAITQTEVQQLPILDRNFTSLAQVATGVRPAEGFDPTKSRVGNLSVNGSDGRAIDVNVDGADNKDNVVGGLIQNYTAEGIQEFNVLTNRYSAESGRALGAVVNVVSRSGTNDFHGSAFGFMQNDNLNRLDFFTAQSCADAGIAPEDCNNPEFKRFHFGGSLGGPILRDRLFVFGAYEHKREPGNITVEPIAFSELALFPLAEPVATLPFPYRDHMLTVKLDHHLSDTQQMFYRYARQRWENPNDQLGNPFTADLSQTQNNTNQLHDFVIGHNWSISPTKVNSLNLHFQDFVNQILADPARTYTLPVAGGGEVTNPNIVFPSGAQIGTNVNVPQQTLERKWQVRNDFTWNVNRHNLKFGGNYIYVSKLGGFFFFGANGYQVLFWDDPSTILSNPAAYPQGFATPGAVQELLFSGGDGNFNQRPHMLAFYFQDDWKVTPTLTLNLGLRWDANINLLPEQLGDSPTNTNRTIGVFRQVLAANPTGAGTAEAMARLQDIAGDEDDLRRKTASWTEFQPRIGFSWDPTGSGRLFIRGGYGIAYDQVFQNLTLFSLQQANPTIYQTLLDLVSPAQPGTGACGTAFLCTFRFGVDPLPAPPAGLTDIEFGAFGRINDPEIQDPYAQQFSIGFQWQLTPDWAVVSDFYHTLGLREPRVLNINPLIREVCDPEFATANPADPRCVRGAETRFLDPAFEGAGLGAGRLEQTNMIGTNNRSRYDTWQVELRRRLANRFMLRTSYVLSWSNSWGGRPTASYSGNAIAITPERQFLENEFGPTIFDERHRFVISGFFQLPWGFEVTPLFQASSSRPLNNRSGVDNDGDGRIDLDRVCLDGSVATGCEMVEVNALRGDPFVQLDLRTAKRFDIGERASIRAFWELFNLFDRDNFCNNFGNNQNSPSTFLQPLGYCGGQGFGGAFSGPMRSQFGLRFEF